MDEFVLCGMMYDIYPTFESKFIHVKWFDISPPVYVEFPTGDEIKHIHPGHAKKSSTRFLQHNPATGHVSSYGVETLDGGCFRHTLTTDQGSFSYDLHTSRHFPYCTNVKKEDCTCPVCGLSFQMRKAPQFRHTFTDETCSKDCASVLKRMNSLFNCGYENHIQTDEVKTKQKETNKSRYGVEHSIASTEVRQKIEKSNEEKYGVKSVLSLPDVRENISKTLEEKYGVSHPAHMEDFGEKLTRTKRINKYGTDDMAIVKSRFMDSYSRGGLSEALSELGCSRTNAYIHFLPHEMRSARSIEQDGVKRFLEAQTGISFEQDIRSIIPSNRYLEADMVNREHKIIVEYNGSYWHGKKTFDKDLRKAELFRELGYKFFAVDEFTPLSTLYRIAAIINPEKIRSYARKLEIREVRSEEASLFLDEHHIQGGRGASIRLGLYDGDDLIQIMTFGKSRFSRAYAWELIRLCTKTGHIVTGGAQRLFRHFVKHYPGSIVSYCDNAFFGGEVYSSLGFQKTSRGVQNYRWVKDDLSYSRYQTQKSKLSKILSTYNPNLSEVDNMRMNGFEQVFDIGQSVFTYESG